MPSYRYEFHCPGASRRFAAGKEASTCDTLYRAASPSHYGTLAIMAGDEKDFEEARELFDVLSSSAMLVGPVGSGNTCKLANQIIVALTAAVGEGLMLAGGQAQMWRRCHGHQKQPAGSTVMNAKYP